MENEELVLIVAKCNVNHKYYYDRSLFYNVLTVAKCNVNTVVPLTALNVTNGINSSKV